jgi:hypothetical protein
MIEFVKNFWCQKVLPLVYTDALSYYEMLGKFVGKLNEVIGNVNNLNENTVFSVNNIKPVNGNVTIDASSFEGFVSGVNGKKPDAGGEVTLTAEDVGAVPDTTVVVSSVNGIAPTEGNVNVGTVKSVNGSMPDASGNVNLPQVSGVTSVDGVGADSSGNVQLNAVKSVNGITPTDGNVNVGTVKSVNGNTPDSAGNVNAGTVKSVNGNSPDNNGNVNAGTVKSVNGATPDNAGNVNVGTVKSVNSSSPDGNGNVNINAANVGAIPNSNGSVGTNLLADKSVTRAKVADEIVYMPEAAIDTASTAYITKAFGGIFNWIYGTGYILEIDGPEFNTRLDTFWETVIYNSEAGDLTIKFTNLPAVYDTRNGTNLGGTSQITLTKYQAIKLKKISNVAMLILPA